MWLPTKFKMSLWQRFALYACFLVSTFIYTFIVFLDFHTNGLCWCKFLGVLCAGRGYVERHYCIGHSVWVISLSRTGDYLVTLSTHFHIWIPCAVIQYMYISVKLCATLENHFLPQRAEAICWSWNISYTWSKASFSNWCYRFWA